ncbi:MAG: peptide-methionine (S)-S-oxide reductase MsrA, partial [Candidatus Levybacteria bacterium]|nr:peptide-methionine (S)-S-oxide reductase MsrA [Candidatus Levybacteria bacterium]
MSQTKQIATFAGGCFWCTEAIFKRLNGVASVTSGYAGGNPPAGGGNPSYEQVSTGATRHAEAVQVEFNPSVIPYTRLLDVFWATHDPTTLNQQGADVGTQYRSVIFYHNEEQKRMAEKSKEEMGKSGKLHDQIVTEILPFEKFYTAEEYHQNYYDTNRTYPYCRVVID